jgi:hypothetical protein
MPFEKVQVVHKFGIISQSHKRQLQERLIKQRKQIENDAKAKRQTSGDELYLFFLLFLKKMISSIRLVS